ncbi:hypothetical protein [Paenibacillus luteus]|uniref:hypothetical protein n=1 Tax=Paenibacillus luteus TaxID=2545753 RepID=UPI0011417B34|nr:hypothetical protein [Paenibacillus luteus]
MNDTAQQTGVQFMLFFEMNTPLISLQEYVMINSIKESITNALKHGKASRVEIAITEQQDTIHMDGKGQWKRQRFGHLWLWSEFDGG